MSTHRHFGLDGPPRPGALRTFDAYRRAEQLALRVAFEPLDHCTSLLLRSARVVLIQHDLDEIERHDELAHQLVHLNAKARRDESLDELETRIRRETAHRLVPLDPLLDAVDMVLDSENAPDAASVAKVLGVQPVTLSDRIRSLTPAELAAGVDSVLNTLIWPTVIGSKTTCLQDSGPTSWLRRLLPSWGS